MIVTVNEEENCCLKKFQKRVEDLGEDEINCLRFLIAREFNLDKAEEMIRNNAVWRKNNNIEALNKDYKIPDFIRKHFPCGFTGKSHNGGPVIWVQYGQWDCRYWFEQGKADEILRFLIYLLEFTLKHVKSSGGERVVAIYDLKGLTYRQLSHLGCIKSAYTFFQALEQNYAEIIETVIIFNAPWVFHAFFAMMKRIISDKTMNKFQIFDSNKNKFLPAIRKAIPEESFMEEYLNL